MRNLKNWLTAKFNQQKNNNSQSAGKPKLARVHTQAKTIYRYLISSLLLASFLIISSPAFSAEMNISGTALPLSNSFYPNDAQREPSVNVNPTDSQNIIIGANDLSNQIPCTIVNGCLLPDPTIGISGIYVSHDGGKSWTHSVLNFCPQIGPQKTNCNAWGDANIMFGPKQNASGGFDYSHGARAYYSTLTGSITGVVAVTFSDDGGNTWSTPALITPINSTTIADDKEYIWVDNNPSSPFFGHLYLVNALFKGTIGNSVAMFFSRSLDGGVTWAKPIKLTSSDRFPEGNYGYIRTDAQGNIYVTWLGDVKNGKKATTNIIGTISHDGGLTFTSNMIIQPISLLSPTLPVPPMPGTSFRFSTYGYMEIDQHSGTIYEVYMDFDTPDNHGILKATLSTDKGQTWSAPKVIVDIPGKNIFMPGFALRADGKVLFVGFNAVPNLPVGTAPGAGVTHYDTFYVTGDTNLNFSAPVQINAAPSDPDGSNNNSYSAQNLGDYNTAVFNGNNAYYVWTDARNAEPCAAIDAYRAARGTANPLPRPDIYSVCSPNFGNADIFLDIVSTQ